MICVAKPLGGGFSGCATNVATVWALAGILSPWQAVQAFSEFKLHLWALENPSSSNLCPPIVFWETSISCGVSAVILEKPMQISSSFWPLGGDHGGSGGTPMCSAPLGNVVDFLGMPGTPCLYAHFLVMGQYHLRYCLYAGYH